MERYGCDVCTCHERDPPWTDLSHIQHEPKAWQSMSIGSSMQCLARFSVVLIRIALQQDRHARRRLGDASANHACLRIRSRLCYVPDSDPCGCKSPALSIGKNVFLDVRRHWLAR
jgi:hypothetical protein